MRNASTCLLCLLCVSVVLTPALADHAEPEPKSGPLLNLYPMNPAAIPFKIVYETLRETDGKENWELYLINADGSDPVNLTKTADVDELYPHASPDGTKVCFVADEGTGRDKARNVYYMNLDGTGRVKVADDARQPCWGPDSKTIAYLKGEFKRYTITDYATRELIFYDIRF
jgi:Tol biopolymer transport system component